MNRSSVADLLRVPAAAYPAFTIDPDVIDLWAEALTDVDAPVARRAMAEWVRESGRPPTVSAVLDACRSAEAERAERREAAAHRPPPVNVERARGTLAFLREVTAAALVGQPWTADAVVAEARFRDLIAPDETFRCRCVDGLEEMADGSMVPCGLCNPVAYERWSEGGYAPRAATIPRVTRR